MIYFVIGLVSLCIGILVGWQLGRSRMAEPILADAKGDGAQFSNIPHRVKQLLSTYSGWQKVAVRFESSIGSSAEEEEYKSYLLYCALMATGSRALAEAADESMQVVAEVRREFKGASEPARSNAIADSVNR